MDSKKTKTRRKQTKKQARRQLLAAYKILSSIGYIPYSIIVVILEVIVFLISLISSFFTLKSFLKNLYYFATFKPFVIVFEFIKSLVLLIGRATKKVIFTGLKTVNFFSVLAKQSLLGIRGIKFKIRLPKIPAISFPKPRLPSLTAPTLSKRLLIRLSFLLLFAFSLATVFYFYVLKDLPSPHDLQKRDQAVSTKIYDRNGALLYKIYKSQNRSLVGLDNIPLFLQQATIAIEDQDFYHHRGLSWRGIIRAVQRNLSKDTLEGGSTITQQLVKNALLTPERTIQRKIKELVLAIETEILFSKEEILKMYFNEVGYGGTAYGVEEAAQLYFGKHVGDLSQAESAMLAGLPAAPTKFSPFGAHPEMAKIRQEEVLRRMAEDVYITWEEAELIKAEKITLAPQRIDIRAPHFVMYVRDLLVKKYGEKMVEEGGLEVVTSLDLELQTIAQATVSAQIALLQRMQVGNGAALVTNPKTGEILAMVGSKDYFDFEHDGNVNVTLASRQPGSSIKPVNYAYALENGYTAASTILDAPITYRVPGQPPYSPVNYDRIFHGKVTLRTALASSYNVPAVKVLSSYGVSKMIEKGQKMGITTWNEPSRFGLSLTLGGGEVRMVDVAVVFGSLANGGFRVDLSPILKVTDYRGRVLEEFHCHYSDFRDYKHRFEPIKDAQAAQLTTCRYQQVIKPAVAFLLTDTLSDNAARTPAFGPSSYLYIPDRQVAVKTGTTDDKRDNWTIGYTPSRLVAVWVGNNDNSPMHPYLTSGVTGAAPIWRSIIDQILKDTPIEKFASPTGINKVAICTINGLLPCEGCPSEEEYFITGTEPNKHCSAEAIKRFFEDKQTREEAERLGLPLPTSPPAIL